MDEHRCSEMETIIKVHRARIDELDTTLDEINKQLAHIKGGVYGICIYAVATQLGILEAIKL
jgi:hypothetical protein